MNGYISFSGAKLTPDLAIGTIDLFADRAQVESPVAAKIMKDGTMRMTSLGWIYHQRKLRDDHWYRWNFAQWQVYHNSENDQVPNGSWVDSSLRSNQPCRSTRMRVMNSWFSDSFVLNKKLCDGIQTIRECPSCWNTRKSTKAVWSYITCEAH